MDINSSNPNKVSRIRTGAALFAVGSISILGCTDKQELPKYSDKTGFSTPLKVNRPGGNCEVGKANVSIASNSEQSLQDFAEEHVDYLSKQNGVDLSQCTDEVVNAALFDRANIEHGIGSPSDLAHTVSLPAQVFKK